MHLILILPFYWIMLTGPAPPILPHLAEDCANARDDDGDGLIDLNDPDCDCALAEPISLIPNPSFEDTLCCPEWRSQLNCADTWIQASEATTDYLHTCGWMGWDSLPPPLPFPDGNAVVGFRNGRFGQEDVPGWKEYAGACLLRPLRRGNAYRFRFNVGFTYWWNSPPTNVVFYGSTDCDNLPFGLGDSNFGCPTNGPGWKRLGSVYASGQNSWVERSIDIIPGEDIYAIAIGPDCVDQNANDDLYYFFDNLVLAEESAFEFQVNAAGNPCSEDYSMWVPAYDSLQYQWYVDGVALPGQTGPTLSGSRGSGRYEVLIRSSTECKRTRPYMLEVPSQTTTLEQVICPGDTYDFLGRPLRRSGTYLDTLAGYNQCDSIIQLNLQVAPAYSDSLLAGFFEGTDYQLGPYRFQDPGQYSARLSSQAGCDSIIYLALEHFKVFFPTAFSPNGDGQNDRFTIFGGADLQAIEELQVFNRWGNQLFRASELLPNDPQSGWDGTFQGDPAPADTYIYSVQLRMRDGRSYHRKGSFTLLR